MSELSLSARPALPRGMKFQWEEAQNAHVLLFPEGQVKFNGSGAAIMSRCNGVRTLADIIADLERTYTTTGLEPDVRAFVALALEKRWLEIAP